MNSARYVTGTSRRVSALLPLDSTHVFHLALVAYVMMQHTKYTGPASLLRCYSTTDTVADSENNNRTLDYYSRALRLVKYSLTWDIFI